MSNDSDTTHENDAGADENEQDVLQIEKNKRKGRRHENQARRILKQTYGKASRVTDTETPNGTTDLFNCADLIAAKYGWPVKFVQVKTNKRPGLNAVGWAKAFVDNNHCEFEYWCRFDREGWEIYRYEPEDRWEGELVKKLVIDTCDVDKAASVYREYAQSIRDGSD